LARNKQTWERKKEKKKKKTKERAKDILAATAAADIRMSNAYSHVMMVAWQIMSSVVREREDHDRMQTE